MSKNQTPETVVTETPAAEEIETVETTETPTIADIVYQIVGDDVNKEFTAYAVHTAINETFKVLGVDKTVRPQMMYNYARNGLIVKGSKGTQTYNNDQVIEFVTKFVTKRVAK